MMTKPQPEAGIVGRTLKWLLPTLLPKHGKRAVFLTTLFIEISKLSPSHRQMLHDLNRHLKLVGNDQALELPIHLQEIVWGGRHPRFRSVDPAEHVSDEDLTAMATEVMSGCREWSRYDDYFKVLEDTKEVIRASIRCHS